MLPTGQSTLPIRDGRLGLRHLECASSFVSNCVRLERNGWTLNFRQCSGPWMALLDTRR